MQLNYSRHVEGINPGFEFGWDTHIYNFELLQDQLCPILDRAFPAASSMICTSEGSSTTRWW